MGHDTDWVLLERYFAGECSPEEIAVVRRWIAEDPTRDRLVAVMRAAWERTGAMPSRRDASAAWSALAARLRAHDDDSLTAQPRRRPAIRLLPVRRRTVAFTVATRIAAAVTLVVFGGALWRAMEPHHAAPVKPGPMQEMVTAAGQRAVLSLGDGTRVTLGVASRLRFPSRFGDIRDVYLDGEAYFEVAHDPGRPFAVHTARAVARDLGTKFNVRAYHDTGDIVVAVAEGAVGLKASGRPAADSLVLRRADVGRTTADGRLSVTHAVELNAYLAWTRGELVFDRTPSTEAIAQINRWYGVDVRLGDSTLATYSLTTTLSTQPFSQALAIVAAALDAGVQRQGSSYLLLAKPRGR